MSLQTLSGTLLAAAALALLPAPAVAEAAVGNDEIAGAIPITSLPYSATSDTSGATAAADDPQSCWSGYTVWYSLRAPEDGTLRASAFASVTVPEGGPFDIASGVAVFTGRPGALVERACQLTGPKGGGVVDVAVRAGQRLWVLAGSVQARSTGTAVALDVRYLPSPQARVGRVGTVSRDGTATLSVGLRCTVAAEVQLSLAVAQSGTRGPSGSVVVPSVSCTPTRRTVRVEVPSTTGVLQPGRARYDLEVASGDADPVSTSGCLRLRRS